MLPIRTILCPTDFSPQSKNALELARALARDYKAKLILLHVKPLPVGLVGEFGYLPPEGPEFREELWDALNRLAPDDPGVAVEPRLDEGPAAETILFVARDSEADLIVMGTHGRTGLGRLFMGSVAEEVMRNAPCPVLTVKEPVTVAAVAAEEVPEIAHA